VNMPLIAVVRLRGEPDRKPRERKTLELLRLHRVNHCVLVPDTPDIRGMLKALESCVTYGEIDRQTLSLLLGRRGRLEGGRRLTLEYLRSLGYESFDDLADALINGKVRLEEVPGIKPVFRLRPPSHGFKGSIKKHVRDGGELGYRGPEINALIRRMV